MEIKGKLPSWLCKLILKQERHLRKEYEEKYLCECKETSMIPLRYAAWRQKKLEPKAIEVLLEECGLESDQ